MSAGSTKSSNRLENGKVAARYAKALFDSLTESGAELGQVRDDLRTLADVLADVPEFSVFLENPGLPLAEKTAFVEERLAVAVTPPVANLLRLLMENNRLIVLPQVAEQFSTYVNQRENVAQAEVITAAELDDDLLARMQNTLQSMFGFNRVDLQHRVDPGLLGGAIIKIQDRVIDGSYVGRLEELRKQVACL
jgi:F-type H+-transporting ATPase subunit delta